MLNGGRGNGLSVRYRAGVGGDRVACFIEAADGASRGALEPNNTRSTRYPCPHIQYSIHHQSLIVSASRGPAIDVRGAFVVISQDAEVLLLACETLSKLRHLLSPVTVHPGRFSRKFSSVGPGAGRRRSPSTLL